VTTVLTRVQLLAFAIITVVAVTYGSARFFNLADVLNPPYEVEAQFSASGGIYPRADVDLLGTRVGSVREIRPGPGSGTTVVLAIDAGVRIPSDVDVSIGNKSAIGEQYVELEPRSPGGPRLQDGDVIEMSRTVVPIDVSTLLKDLDGLAASIPLKDLEIAMREISAALEGLGPTMGRLIEDTDRVTRTSLEHVDDLTALIDDASVVLDTQVDKGPQTTAYLRELAPLMAQVRRLDGSLAQVFGNGFRAGTEISHVLADNRAALPVLLDNLVTVTDVATNRVPALRKTLTLLPWSLELNATGIRPCGEYDPETGEPIEKTCNYDAQGRPIWSTYLGVQLPELPVKPPYYPCTKGYEGTTKYLPNGVPLNGGPKQERDSPPNMDARCTASPGDPQTPNVRGAQNAHDYGTGTGLARVAPAVAPPDGMEGLAWLLTLR
jgi:phospholipid/cholesterol/gamma-HCH transport system substrate-binding protein